METYWTNKEEYPSPTPIISTVGCSMPSNGSHSSLTGLLPPLAMGQDSPSRPAPTNRFHHSQSSSPTFHINPLKFPILAPLALRHTQAQYNKFDKAWQRTYPLFTTNTSGSNDNVLHIIWQATKLHFHND